MNIGTVSGMRNGQTCVASVLVLSLMLTSVLTTPVLAATTPTVTIEWPRDDQILAGNVSVEGQATGATSVEVDIDSTVWRPATGTSDWNYTWDTKGYADGRHTVSAWAKNGTVTSDVITVIIYVNNTPPKDIVMDLSAIPLQIGAGDNITVSGFVDYDTGVALANVPVKIEVLSTNISLTVNTDMGGYLITTFRGPTVANKYTLRATVTDGKLSMNQDFQLTVTTPTQPDLAIESLYINPIQPAIGSGVLICATVENLGTESATSIIKFYVDGNYLDSETVSVGSPRVVKAEWSAAFGVHTIKVVADDVNPTDKDLSNNQRSIKVTPTPMPDVSITELAVSNQAPRQGDLVSILVRLGNTGYAGADGTLKVYDGNMVTGKLIGSESFQLASNETTGIYMTWKAVQGQHMLTAQLLVNYQGRILYKVVNITVLPAVQTKKTFIPFPGTIETLAVIATIAIIINLKRRPRTSR